MYRKINITEYLPKRYQATTKQEEDREMCYDFKDGILTEKVKNAFLKEIKEIAQDENWVVCFIPASTTKATKLRFRKLANAIREAGYQVEEDAIFNEYDKAPEHVSGKSSDPIASFGFNGNLVKGKKVILIDDIITRGITFTMTADKLFSAGATCVVGLFLAQTINPDYRNNYNYEESVPDDVYDDPYEEEATYDNYNGSYAQDIEGWSDQDIDDVFDGDPDAYWNID